MARVNGKSPNGTVASRERREALRKYQMEQERKEKREQRSGWLIPTTKEEADLLKMINSKALFRRATTPLQDE